MKSGMIGLLWLLGWLIFGSGYVCAKGETETNLVRGKTMDEYQQDILNKIENNWFPPSSFQKCSVRVVFDIGPDGKVSHFRIKKHSSVQDPIFDASVLKAVNTAPFPPHPYGGTTTVDHLFGANLAESHWRHLMEKSPTAENFIGLAGAYEQQKPSSERDPSGSAIDMYKMALKVDPNSQIAKERLRVLEPLRTREVWTRRIEFAISRRLSDLTDPGYRGVQLVAKVAYTVGRDGHIADTRLTEKSASSVFDANVLKAINSLNGDAVLQFPAGTTEASITLDSVFKLPTGLSSN